MLRRRDLLGLGCTDSGIRGALRRARIIRVRHGWYALAGLPEVVYRAVRLGGALTGGAALETYGVWAPRGEHPEFRVGAHAARLRLPTDSTRRLAELPEATRVRWHGPAPAPGGAVPVWRVSLLEALRDLLHTADRFAVISACDSALHHGLISRDELDALFSEGPVRVRGWRRLVDGRAEAGGETEVRLRLLDVGIETEPQFRVPGAGRFDLRVDRVLLEVDGRAHHDDAESFHRDRQRDLMAAVWGFRVIHLSYAQIEGEWPLCLAAIRRALAA